MVWLSWGALPLRYDRANRQFCFSFLLLVLSVKSPAFALHTKRGYCVEQLCNALMLSCKGGWLESEARVAGSRTSAEKRRRGQADPCCWGGNCQGQYFGLCGMSSSLLHIWKVIFSLSLSLSKSYSSLSWYVRCSYKLRLKRISRPTQVEYGSFAVFEAC